MADVTSTFAAKDVGFTSTVNRMQKTLAGFQSNLGGFATKLAGLAAAFVGVQQSVAAFNSALAMGGRLDDLSKTTGASAGELALLEKAFALAGSSAEAVGPAIARLNRFMVEASNGAKAQTETMDKLGLSYAQLAGLTPTEQMRLLAKSIMALPTPAERTAAAMDIFGRSGSTLIPLFANFSGELDKAQGYLGSLPGLLDQSAGAMADMEDDIGAIGDKFGQFVAGLVAGAAGADNFASALAKIDTAGIGANLGEQLRVAFDAPLETAQAIGYTLLTGIKQAGNNLMDGFATAVSFFQNLFSDSQYWSGIGLRVQAMFMESINAFNKLLLSAVEGALLKPLSNLPGILGEPFRTALETTNEIRDSLESASRANAENLAQGGAKIQEAIERAKANTIVIQKDWLDVEQSAADAARHFLDAEQRSKAIRQNAEKTAENYGQGSAALRDALAEVRGFDLMPKSGPEERPDWFKSNQPPPQPSTLTAGATNAGTTRSITHKSQTALQALQEAAKTDPRARAEIMRLQNEQNERMNRAGDLRERGMFGSAARVEIRAEQRAAERAARAIQRQISQELFGSRNLGDAVRNFERDAFAAGMTSKEGLERMGITPVAGESTRDAIQRMLKEQTKSDAERKNETSTSLGRFDSSKSSNPEKLLATEATLQKLVTEVIDRLPQHALV